jgi:cell division protein FtsB
LSQAANTFWVNRVNASVKSHSVAKRGIHMNRMFDGIVMVVILATCAICTSYYLRTRAEFDAALSKQQAATERVAGLASEVERLDRDVQRLRTDAKAFEEFARHKFGFVRSDDVVIKLAQNDSEAATSAPSGAARLANLTPQTAAGYTKFSH